MASGLRKLAQVTGLSTATVSRALNNRTNVTEKTRQRVIDAADRIGYKPNAAARALTTKRSRTIGAVIPTLENSIFARFINSIEDTLAQRGYSLVIATTHNDPVIETQRTLDLLNMGTEGLIVSGLCHTDKFMSVINSRQIPTVATSIFSPEGEIPSIGYDNESLGRSAAQYLKQSGHQNPAIIHGPLANNDRTRLRLEGIREIFPTCPSVEVGLSVKGGVEGCRYFLNQPNIPSSILCLSDILALGVLFEAPTLGVSIPDQLSVMGFDNLEWSSSVTPALTTFDLPVDTMGHQVANALMDFLDDEKPLLSQRLDSRLIERESVRQLL